MDEAGIWCRTEKKKPEEKFLNGKRRGIENGIGTNTQ